MTWLNEWVEATKFLKTEVNRQKLQQWGVGPKSHRIDMSKDMALARKDTDLLVWYFSEGGVEKPLAATYHGQIEWYRKSQVPGATVEALYQRATGAFAISVDPDVVKKMDLRKIFEKPAKVQVPVGRFGAGEHTGAMVDVTIDDFLRDIHIFKQWLALKEFDVRKDLQLKKTKVRMHVASQVQRNMQEITRFNNIEYILSQNAWKYINSTVALLSVITDFKNMPTNRENWKNQAAIENTRTRMNEIKQVFDNWKQASKETW